MDLLIKHAQKRNKTRPNDVLRILPNAPFNILLKMRLIFINGYKNQ